MEHGLLVDLPQTKEVVDEVCGIKKRVANNCLICTYRIMNMCFLAAAGMECRFVPKYKKEGL